MNKRAAVFLDRDGVINEKMPEGDYVKDWNEFRFQTGVFEALRILKEKSYMIGDSEKDILAGKAAGLRTIL